MSKITWSSGDLINYTFPDGLASGVYTFNITLTDGSGNSASHFITVTITGGEGGAIPFGNYFLIFIGMSICYLLLSKKHKILKKS